MAVKPKPPFKPIFQVAATREGSGIRIVNEPLEGSSVFLVETGESRTPPETTIDLGKVSKQPPKYERMVAWDGQRNARDAVTVRVG